MKTETIQQQQEERQVTSIPGVETPLEGRAALAAARQEDRAWRTRREVRVKRILQFIRSVSEWGVIGLWLMMLALVVVAVGSLLFGLGIGLLTGDPAPEWIVRSLWFGMAGLIVGGLLAVGGYLVGRGLETGVRRWAARQAIDLSDESEAGVRSRRRRRRAR